ncbi:MAG: glycosyltransferase [Pseudomonadota bacterium]|nr:glycosyltransferase [Pseudomonadota bacterium]
MKIAHVTSGLSVQGAGVRAVVEALARTQSDAGHELAVFGLEDADWRAGARDEWSGLSVEALPIKGPGALGYAPGMTRALTNWAPDVVHLHGLWMHPARSVLQWHRRTERPYVLSPHGMLSAVALSYSPLKKRIVRHLFQDRAFAEAASLLATSVGEREEIRAFGLGNPVATLANGVAPIEQPQVLPQRATKTLLTLGRVHRKKGIDVLLEAWARLEPAHPDWSLRIVGPDEEGHTQELKSLVARLGVTRVDFVGPVYGPERDVEMAAADIFVLPTRSENFALTVAESLMLEVPVVSSKGAPWPGLEAHGCGRWVDLDPAGLAEALAGMMAEPEAVRREMGRRGRAWMRADFAWPVIGASLAELYDWARGGAPAPAFLEMGSGTNG